MISYSFSSTHARRRVLIRLTTAAIFSILAAVPALGQGGGAIDSDPTQAIGNRLTARNTIQGFVSYPNGVRLDRRVKVRISGTTGSSLFAFTDDNGAFIFRRLASGSYFLTVDAGKEFETANETVDIFDPRGGSSNTQTVYIQLRHRRAAATGKPGTVNAALADVPKPALKLYEKALKAAQEGNGEKAIESLKGALEIHPTFMLALNEMGVQYLRLRKFDEAAAALRSALALSPADALPQLNYGIALFYQKRLPEADEQLRRVLEKHSNSAVAHLFRGRIFLKLGKNDEAEKELQQAATLDGNGDVNEAYRYLGGIYQERGEYARAIEALEKYLTLEPKTRDADAIREILKELRKTTPPAKK